MKKKIKLCKTKYSGYANNHDNCLKEDFDGCENCDWYVSELILKTFENFEKNGFLKSETDLI